MKQIITIKGKPVIEIYESFDGSYWFITEKLYKQDSVIHGQVYKNDQILFGFVRLSAHPEFAEWGNISETELKLLEGWVWKVPRINWPFCPEVEVKYVAEPGESEKQGKQQKAVKAENKPVKKKSESSSLKKGRKENFKKLRKRKVCILFLEEMPKDFKSSEGKKMQIKRGNNCKSLEEKEEEEEQDLSRLALSDDYGFLTPGSKDTGATWKPVFNNKDYSRFGNKQEINRQYRQQSQIPAHYNGNSERNYQQPLHIDYNFSRNRQLKFYRGLQKMTGKERYLSRRVKILDIYGKRAERKPERGFNLSKEVFYKSLDAYLDNYKTNH